MESQSLSQLVKLPKIIPVLKMLNETEDSSSNLLLDNISNRTELFSVV